MDDQTPVWLFDGYCILCSRSVDYVISHEKEPKLYFVAIQSDVGRKLALDNGIDPDEPESFLFVENGRVLSKSDGVIALARYLRGLPRLIALAKLMPRPLRDALYDLLARNRYKVFGKNTACRLPDPSIAHRFIL